MSPLPTRLSFEHVQRQGNITRPNNSIPLSTINNIGIPRSECPVICPSSHDKGYLPTSIDRNKVCLQSIGITLPNPVEELTATVDITLIGFQVQPSWLEANLELDILDVCSGGAFGEQEECQVTETSSEMQIGHYVWVRARTVKHKVDNAIWSLETSVWGIRLFSNSILAFCECQPDGSLTGCWIF
jgi:hypothetical protein